VSRERKEERTKEKREKKAEGEKVFYSRFVIFLSFFYVLSLEMCHSYKLMI